MNEVNQNAGRPKTKAEIIPFKFKKPLAKYLRAEAKKTGKTMVAIVEELLEYRMKFKAFPPAA